MVETHITVASKALNSDEEDLDASHSHASQLLGRNVSPTMIRYNL